MLEKLEVSLSGISPLLMHNGQLADPTNSYTKALKEATSKRAKTDSDILEVRRLEWLGGLYRDLDGRIAIPASNVLALVIKGSQQFKLGPKSKAGVFETEPYYRLKYDGPKDIDKLYDSPGFCDYRSVIVSRNRVMRARPRFETWEVPVTLAVNTDVISLDDVHRSLVIAGELHGLGDWRPRFGRFEVI